MISFGTNTYAFFVKITTSGSHFLSDVSNCAHTFSFNINIYKVTFFAYILYNELVEFRHFFGMKLNVELQKLTIGQKCKLELGDSDM